LIDICLSRYSYAQPPVLVLPRPFETGLSVASSVDAPKRFLPLPFFL
jgi:hypothetical protein